MLTRYVHRILLVVLVLTGAGVSYVQAQTSGKCGAYLNWTYYSYSKTLNISGNGTMYNYDASSKQAPWASYRNDIQKISISSSVTTIGEYAFYNCQSVTSVTIGSSVTQIGQKAFYWCSSLPSVQIPKSVTNIGSQAFQYCHALQDIYVLWTTDGTIPTWQSMTNQNHSTMRLHVPCETSGLYADANGWKNYKNHIIEEHSYGSCGSFGDNATWVLSCDSVLTISGTGALIGNAFRNHTEIKHVIIEEGITDIGSQAFYNCANLVSVSNPSTLKGIGVQAFQNCKQLDTINFPEGLTTIGSTAFYECNSLRSIHLPSTVMTINQDAFLRTFSVTSIVVDPTNTKYDSRNNCNAIIETANNKLWYGCRNTVIPDGVVEVASFAYF